MPFQPQALDQKTLKRLAKRLHRSWVVDFQQHPETKPNLARSQEVLAHTFDFSNWHEASGAVKQNSILVDARETSYFSEKSAVSTATKNAVPDITRGTGVPRPYDFPGWQEVLPILEKIDGDEVSRLTVAILNLFSADQFQKPEDLEKFIANLRRHNKKLEKLSNSSASIVLPILLNFLIWKCREQQKNGLAIGLLRVELSRHLRATKSELDWNEDGRCWQLSISYGFPALIGVLLTLNQLSSIDVADDATTWKTRWVAISNHACGTNHINLAVFSLWLQMDQEAQSTPAIGQMLSKILSEIHVQTATVFSILWQARRYDEAIHAAAAAEKCWS